jgi:inorganic pyrophosphatase/exopolyphosphatase
MSTSPRHRHHTLVVQTSHGPHNVTLLELPNPHLPVESPSVLVRQSSVDEAVDCFGDAASECLVDLLPHPDDPVHGVVGMDLGGCVFVGHLATDMDSIGAAIGGALLFDGIAAAASELNSETLFALEYWGMDAPPRVEEVLAAHPSKPVCLVDHNQVSQVRCLRHSAGRDMPPLSLTAPSLAPSLPHLLTIAVVDAPQMNRAVQASQVRGIIDHHALQSHTLQTDKPIFVDIRPWGSASTIIADMFIKQRKPLTRGVAGLLLSAILSDTLNLHSPTTTDADRLIVAVLVKLTGLADATAYAKEMFKAKSKNLRLLSAHGLVRGDLKTFQFGDVAVAFGVVETVEPEVVLARRDELLLELRALKPEMDVDLAFLAVVDVLAHLQSDLLLCGPGERALAATAFPEFAATHDGTLLHLGKRVSRKLDFIPPIAVVFNGGWRPPAETFEPSTEHFGAVVQECSENGCVTRRTPVMKAFVHAAVAVQRMVGLVSTSAASPVTGT